MDDEARVLLAQAPRWMQLDAAENPLPLPPNAPAWLEWQRNAYLVSTAHKVIILHRPFLGRAFKDPRYKRSRDVCVGAARRILRLLRSCDLEPFRKTWTVLACVARLLSYVLRQDLELTRPPHTLFRSHSTAASVILVMEYAHSAGSFGAPPAAVDEDPIRLVSDAILIFEGLRASSTIAAKAVIVLTSLVEETLRKMNGGAGPGTDGNKRKAHQEAELDRAVKVLRRASSTSSFHAAGTLSASPGSGGPSQATTYAPLTPSFHSLGYDVHPTPRLPQSTLPANSNYSPYVSANDPHIGGSGPLDPSMTAFHGQDFANVATPSFQPQFADDEFEFMLRDFDLGHGVPF